MEKVDTQPYRFRGLNHFILVLFPGLATVYFGLWSVWGYSKAEWVFGCLAILNLCYILVFGWLKKYDGNIIVVRKNRKRTFSLELEIDPLEIENRSSIEFKVVDEPGDDYLDVEMALGDESQDKHSL